MRERIRAHFRVGHFYVSVQIQHLVPGLDAVYAVEQDGFLHLLAGLVYGVEGIQRVLEDHADILAPDGLHLPAAVRAQVVALEDDLPFDLLVAAGQEVHDGMGDRGFAAAGFSDDGQDLAAVDGQIHVVDRGQVPALDFIVDAQVFEP